jgi:hypothetical protein
VPVDGSDVSPPVAGAEGSSSDESLDSIQSSITIDTNGNAYEAKFEKLAQQLLRRRAKDKSEFTRMLEDSYGPGYDHAAGEELRQKMVRGDFSWTPVVHLTTSAKLGGHLGAYAASTRTVYLDGTVPNQLVRAFVYLEELGHHIDTLLNKADAKGDEGTLFRMNMVGERFTPDIMAQIRNGSDQGTIVIDGQVIQVEFLFGWVTDFLGAAWGGIKSGAGWVWKGATTAGAAIATAATKTWDGAQVLGGWIYNGAKIAVDKYVELCKRSFWAVYQQTQTLVNSLVVFGYGSYEALKVMGDAVVEISKGNFVDGAAALMVGLAKLAVEVPLDTLSSQVIETLSTLQTLLFLEPEGRYLNSQEKAYLSWVFWGGDWWLDLVRIKEGFCGLWSLSPRPFTVEQTIYLKNWPSDQNLSAAQREALMVHESTHAWQFIHGGGDYKLDSLYYQARYGDASYLWAPSVDAGTQWGGLHAEQQASFVEDAYVHDCYGFSGTCSIDKDRLAYFLNVDTQITNGQGAP